ncbi:MAG: hypothetical protein ACE5I5_07300 [Candidatus Heimdallarchaeota archaeon]
MEVIPKILSAASSHIQARSYPRRVHGFAPRVQLAKDDHSTSLSR